MVKATAQLLKSSSDNFYDSFIVDIDVTHHIFLSTEHFSRIKEASEYSVTLDSKSKLEGTKLEK